MVDWGKLEFRHDTDYYLPRHYRLLKQIANSGHEIKKLYEVSRHIVDGPFGSAIKADDYVELGVPFIRVADVTHGDGTLDIKDMIYISDEAHKSIKRSTASPGDVIIAKTGATMGAASVVPTSIPEANIRGDLALVGKLDSWSDADYLSTFINTNIGYKLFWRLNSGSTRGRVVISNLKKFPVIWPKGSVRDRIVKLAEQGRQQKNQRNAEADALLASINDYLLSELGILLPPEPDNSIGRRMTLVEASDLNGWRFDPYFYKQKFVNWDNALKSATYPSTNFRSLTRSLVNGFDCRDFVEDGLAYAKVAQVKPYEIRLEKAQFVPQSSVPARGRSRFGDLLLTRKGSFGIAALNRLEQEIGFSSEVFRIHINRDLIHDEYFEAILNSQIGQIQFDRHKIGAIMGSLAQNVFGKINIPLPDMKIQIQIAKQVSNLRMQAKNLQLEANSELEKAKAEIESILLGDVT